MEIRSTAAIAVLGGALLSLGPAAEARTFRVNDAADLPDTRPGDGICDVSGRRTRPVCTLRAAVMEANATRGEDKILLHSGTYRLDRLGHGENAAARGDLDIRDDLVIQGESEEGVTINASGLDRVFHILGDGLTVSFRRLVITGGRAPGTDPGAGGIHVSGRRCTVDLYRTRLEDNAASDGSAHDLCMRTGTLRPFQSRVANDFQAPDCGGIVTASLPERRTAPLAADEAIMARR